MNIQNGIIFGQDKKFHEGDISVSGEIITSHSEDSESIDASGLYIIPGLTDIHFHGANGHDFCDGTLEAFNAIHEYELEHGITTICPATMTLPENELSCIMTEAKRFSEMCKNFAGVYLEGPFISPSKIGAQNPEYISRPDINMLMRLQNDSGNMIRIAVVAPEAEDAMKFIDEAKDIMRVSIAHTSCDYDTARKAFTNGASQVTHLYNAMNPIKHREPGPIIAALENENVNVELICDGIHIHPAVVRSTIKAFGADRVIFISDSMEAAGMPDGEYMLGGQKVIKKGNKATLKDGITIAGSVTNLMDCMRIAVRDMGVKLEDAVTCSAINPARAIGIDSSLREGNIANLIALDRDLNIKWIMNRGKIIFGGIHDSLSSSLNH
ncbi:MAG: N-acetylglucosamine-6-phosphate deacetylase [Synergistaceae bacterium]|nr:N-acetylglucosamine-6-phosphate deacetylase [Synergistaceae bacterium]